MSRIILAFSCFFRLLFGGRLHPSAAEYLPAGAGPALPDAGDEAGADEKPTRQSPGDGDEVQNGSAGKGAGKGDASKGDASSAKDGGATSDDAAAAEAAARAKAERRSATIAEHHRDGALALLGLLQREGRLIDFLREDLDDYDDEDIGASVRDIHRGCRKVVDDHLALEPVMPGEEDEDVNVPKGFDPGEIRLVGDVDGDPPFKGVMRHHGWRVTEAKLPTLTEGVDRHVLAPAEVEIS